VTLKRYWFSFDTVSGSPRLRLGCGVTAASYADAVALLQRRLPAADIAALTNCIEDIDVSTLDPDHILPNIGDITVPGIWFPLGLR